MKNLAHFVLSRGRFAWRLFLVCWLVVMAAGTLKSQSTYGSVLGLVRDQTGAVLQGAQITLQNQGTQATQVTTADESGDYAFRNVEVGSYKVTIAAGGFAAQFVQITLTARESRRIDAVLRPGAGNETVEVREDAEPVVTTEVSNLAVTKMGDELVNLPVAVYARSTGSTSPISTLTTESGVQTDDSGNLSVMGASPALLSVTIDGISSVGVEYSGPVNEMFPSFNSIEEIRVSESNNNAEFSGVADITTVSKAGTVAFHGSVFENHENSVFNANNSFALAKPRIIMNDFGGTLGGPLRIPLLTSRPDKTFFFASYEGLRLPRETPILLSVPSAAMRTGDLTSYLGSDTPVQVAPGPIAANVLKYLYPTPNYGDPDSWSNNYQVNFPAPISANQGDFRLDRTISQRQSVFARFSYKNRQVQTAPSEDCIYTYCAEAGSPLLGAFNTPEIDEGLTFAHNFVFNSNLLNEFRGGYNAQHASEMQNFSTTDLLQKTGFLASVPQPNLEWSEAPEIMITGFMSTGAGNPGMQRGQIIQLLDNVTWTRGRHTFKFGGDLKRLSDHDDNVYGNYRSGWYVFNGTSNVGQGIGDPYTAFLMGYPDYTQVSTTNNPKMDGLGYSYAVFAQDDWKVLPNLTLNIGLRYETHPPIRETNRNTATFLPDWTGTGSDGSSSVKGAVVVSNTQASNDASQAFRDSIAPTPILTAAQAGIPEVLRYTDRTDFGPRIGFAWRPRGNDKLVVRGGWGRFIGAPMGFSLVAGWAVANSYVPTYDQDFDEGGVTPQLSLDNPFNAAAAGMGGFYYAFPVHYKDPTVQQWNLTVEQDLGKSIGLRLSYSGSRGRNLEAMEDLNQVKAGTQGYGQIADGRPYPNWSVIQSVANVDMSNYSSGTIELSRRSGKSLTFNAGYTFTRDLSNAGGIAPNAFTVAGGVFLSDRFNPRLDYGNVAYDRRHRFLSTYMYALPFGRGERWLSTGRVLNALAGGFTLAGVTVVQSGPFLTPFQQSVDPANTNILTTVGVARTDQLRNVSPYAAQRTTAQWLNPAAFPYENLASDLSAGDGTGIGRFGNAPVGGVVGPGTVNMSMSLLKSFSIRENTSFRFGVEAANILNHRNYQPPNMQADSAGFGSISGLQNAEGAGPRSLELTGRISF
jgi:hypothetical protein